MIIASKMLRSLTITKYRNRFALLSAAESLQNTGYRAFQSNATLSVKMFIEHENNYAYSIMENKGYTMSLNIEKGKSSISKEEFEQLLKENWSKKQPSQLFEIFPILGIYCSENGLCISNKVFDDFIDSLTENLKLASNKELESIFFSLEKWPKPDSVRTRNYIEVWVALDDECLNRLKTVGIWSFDEMLSFVALFYMLNVTRLSDFSKKCLQKLVSKAKQLTPSQQVQTMFFISVFRKQPYDMHNMELHLQDNFSNFSVDDLAIMSMGFFKSKTPIRNMELVSQFINKVIESSKDIHEVSLAALLKVIRYSMKVPEGAKSYRLLDTLQHEVPRLSIMCIVHLALLGTNTLTLHKQCLSKIADKIISSMSETRMKDLERLVLTFGTFNFMPPTKECFFQKVIEELRKPERQLEIDKHGRSFACCIGYLSLCGFYPVDLMNKVLNPDFLEKAYGKQCFLFGREVLTIHNTSEIFCKEAKINRLSEKAAKILAKRYTDYVPNENFSKQYNITEKMFLDVFKVMKDSRGGSEYVVGDHILTHHQRGDIIMCNNHEGLPLPVTDVFNDKKFGLLRRLPDDNKWIVLVLVGRNSIIYNSDTPTGHYQAKVKELKALGFHATLVPFTIYVNLKTTEEKLAYLNCLIGETVN